MTALGKADRGKSNRTDPLVPGWYGFGVGLSSVALCLSLSG